jgi:bifunctional UDP-N-acetylglucosamine pyrophosphorylase/glucosamine-1-phosphate N-acetyltransferase
MKRTLIVLVHGMSGGAGGASRSEELLGPLLGRPVISYVLDSVSRLGPRSVVFCGTGLPAPYGPARPRVKAVLAKTAGKAAPGGGIVSALLAAAPALPKKASGEILAVPAGMPLIQPRTLKNFLAGHRRNGCSLSVLGCGSDLEKDSIVAFRAEELVPLLPRLAKAGSRAGLRHLTALLAARDGKVGVTEISDPGEGLNVRKLSDLARAAGVLRLRKSESLSRRGVVVFDPPTTWIDWDVVIGPGTVVYPSVVVEGASRVGRDCRIYPHVHIASSTLGDRVKVLAATVIDGTRVDDDAQVGPFSRLRPGTVVRAGSRVGNFVEMKNTDFGPRSKAQHLSYLGDSVVEEGVNVGAGTITCNYDGFRKNRTHIEAGAFIGSGTELVAPVRIGKGAYVAAGSTITKDVPPGSLAVGRARQIEKPGWVLERMRKIKGKARPRK